MITVGILAFASGAVLSALYLTTKFDKELRYQVARSYRSGYNHCVYVGGRRRV